jgi:hypothetical protein
MSSTYIALERVSENDQSEGPLSVTCEHSQEVIGSASFLLDVWSPKGIVGLYELFVDEKSVGAFALRSDATFISYARLAEDAHLPPEPQHAVMVATRDNQTRDRELICPVYYADADNESEQWYLYHKRPGAITGKYEHPAKSLMDEFHYSQQLGSHALLLPYPIEQLATIGSGAR